MRPSLYADAAYAVPDSIEAIHGEELASLTRAGTWWNGRQRAAIVAEARAVWGQAPTTEQSRPDLPPGVRATAREIASGGLHVDRAYVHDRIAAGLTEETYVETVGVVARAAHLDVFARAIGVPPRPLPPADLAEPSRARPATAVDEGFHVATIPAGARGGAEGEALFGKDIAPNILRSLSLVPDEARRLIAVINSEYMTPAQIMDFEYSPYPALSRPQVELIAAQVSALNQCFY